MPRFIHIICVLAILNSIPVLSQDSLEISLLTCSPGPEIYSTFGHSAIRVKDTLRGLDRVYDYGTFDFNTPNFTLKFIKGNLKYRLSTGTFNQFIEVYTIEGKGVIEEKLNLTTYDKERFYKLLKENQKPENRYYHYDFFFDNCSTRIRDLIEGLESVSYQKEEVETNKSFNDGLNEHFSNKEWLGLGINLVLGQSADKIMTYRNQMFLPKYLSKNLSSYSNRENGKSILQSPKALLPNRLVFENSSSFKLSPLLCFSLVLLVVVFAFFRKPHWLHIITPILYFSLGFAGLLLLFLWFGTSHHTTRFNWNVIWASPVYIVLIFLKKSKIKNYVLITLSIITVLLLFGLPIIPQCISPVFILLLLSVLIINYNSVFNKT